MKRLVLDLVPEGSEVHVALSETMAQLGVTSVIETSQSYDAVRPKLLAIPEAISLSFDPPSIPGISTTGGFEFQVEDLTGRGPQALHEAAQALLAAHRGNVSAASRESGLSRSQFYRLLEKHRLAAEEKE